MNEHAVNGYDRLAAAENPFCTRRVRPGALPYLFAAGQSAAGLVDRLRQNGWWGQITGPHGSGKSALLAALVPALEEAGRQPLAVGLHDRQRRLPIDPDGKAALHASSLLVVDGYEQLGRFSRFRVKRLCRRRGSGLLVTAHAPVGFAGLCQTAPDLELTRRIVDQLQHDHPALVTADDVAAAFARQAGNLRETLFELYDLYESRRRE